MATSCASGARRRASLRTSGRIADGSKRLQLRGSLSSSNASESTCRTDSFTLRIRPDMTLKPFIRNGNAPCGNLVAKL